VRFVHVADKKQGRVVTFSASRDLGSIYPSQCLLTLLQSSQSENVNDASHRNVHRTSNSGRRTENFEVRAVVRKALRSLERFDMDGIGTTQDAVV